MESAEIRPFRGLDLLRAGESVVLPSFRVLVLSAGDLLECEDVTLVPRRARSSACESSPSPSARYAASSAFEMAWSNGDESILPSSCTLWCERLRAKPVSVLCPAAAAFPRSPPVGTLRPHSALSSASARASRASKLRGSRVRPSHTSKVSSAMFSRVVASARSTSTHCDESALHTSSMRLARLIVLKCTMVRAGCCDEAPPPASEAHSSLAFPPPTAPRSASHDLTGERENGATLEICDGPFHTFTLPATDTTASADAVPRCDRGGATSAPQCGSSSADAWDARFLATLTMLSTVLPPPRASVWHRRTSGAARRARSVIRASSTSLSLSALRSDSGFPSA